MSASWEGLSVNSVLWKTDVEHAYKLIPILGDDITILGMKWLEDWLLDAILPIGICSECSIFQDFSSAIQFLIEKRG